MPWGRVVVRACGEVCSLHIRLCRVLHFRWLHVLVCIPAMCTMVLTYRCACAEGLAVSSVSVAPRLDQWFPPPTGLFSFMTMCLWAGANRNTVDEEYGPGFAMNCVAWCLALAWTLHAWLVGAGYIPAVPTSGKASGVCRCSQSGRAWTCKHRHIELTLVLFDMWGTLIDICICLHKHTHMRRHKEDTYGHTQALVLTLISHLSHVTRSRHTARSRLPLSSQRVAKDDGALMSFPYLMLLLGQGLDTLSRWRRVMALPPFDIGSGAVSKW